MVLGSGRAFFQVDLAEILRTNSFSFDFELSRPIWGPKQILPDSRSSTQIVGSRTARHTPCHGRNGRSVRAYIATPDSGSVALTDARLPAGSISFYLNEGANKLMVRVRYSNGSLKDGEISLT